MYILSGSLLLKHVWKCKIWKNKDKWKLLSLALYSSESLQSIFWRPAFEIDETWNTSLVSTFWRSSFEENCSPLNGIKYLSSADKLVRSCWNFDIFFAQLQPSVHYFSGIGSESKKNLVPRILEFVAISNLIGHNEAIIVIIRN